MHLTNFIFTRTFFLIASYQISKNDVILINHGSFFQEKDSKQLNRFQFSRINKLLPNSAIFLEEFCYGKLIFNGFSHERIYFQKLGTVKL